VPSIQPLLLLPLVLLLLPLLLLLLLLPGLLLLLPLLLLGHASSRPFLLPSKMI
jgi:hypothetical protein